MGTIHWLTPDLLESRVEGASEAPTLAQMQEFVGGYVERLNGRLNGRKVVLYVNEEGRMIRPLLAVNASATVIFQDYVKHLAHLNGVPMPRVISPILGNVICLEGIPEE